MTGQRVGYVRVSTFDQNSARQLENENIDRVFSDKASGKDIHRPQLKELLKFVREGDTVVVHSMDRLARNLDAPRKIVKDLTSRDVSIKFIKENLTFDNQVSPMSNLLLSVMGAFVEFERSLIKERQREGIELAKKRGVYKGRRSSLSKENMQNILERLDSGEAKTAIAKSLGISRETLYQHLRKMSDRLDNKKKVSA